MNGGQLRLSQVWPFQLQNICLLRCPRATQVWRGGRIVSGKEVLYGSVAAFSPTLDPGPARSLSVHPLNWLPTAAGWGWGGGAGFDWQAARQGFNGCLWGLLN